MFEGMGMLTVEVSGRDVSRQLDPVLNEDAFRHVPVPIEQWWEMPVYVQSRFVRNSSGQDKVVNTHLTREDIILAAANKDGGAHVDEKLEPNYERLAASGALGMYGPDHGRGRHHRSPAASGRRPPRLPPPDGL